ncbi:hypothetical protein CLI92_09280 [Vandammella animalimorsus]|uniref:Uncharacterized protein n=1 Tax=Vandammella animalimorsus TaxID=2029117 RepID=A0A2A2T5S4_9BURK|nr:hypothetical protein [Vandammella animalimorsus]PAT31842.1 hypothetical protein CK626_07525 [Vandammella animalimorsus]PAX16511.1 hypothetical protein CLI92_09280 [Vandammella animalimorsus]PAX18926.1 hypothetical protein CLI93_11360 [Vandammella animalimorsus]
MDEKLHLIQAESVDAKPRHTEDIFEKHRHEAHLKNMDRGWLGVVFGMGATTGINIAGLVCILTLVTLIVSLFVEIKGDASTMRAAMIGLISSALSYIFGAAKR